MLSELARPEALKTGEIEVIIRSVSSSHVVDTNERQIGVLPAEERPPRSGRSSATSTLMGLPITICAIVRLTHTGCRHVDCISITIFGQATPAASQMLSMLKM